MTQFFISLVVDVGGEDDAGELVIELAKQIRQREVKVVGESLAFDHVDDPPLTDKEREKQERK